MKNGGVSQCQLFSQDSSVPAENMTRQYLRASVTSKVRYSKGTSIIAVKGDASLYFLAFDHGKDSSD